MRLFYLMMKIPTPGKMVFILNRPHLSENKLAHVFESYMFCISEYKVGWVLITWSIIFATRHICKTFFQKPQSKYLGAVSI